MVLSETTSSQLISPWLLESCKRGCCLKSFSSVTHKFAVFAVRKISIFETEMMVLIVEASSDLYTVRRGIIIQSTSYWSISVNGHYHFVNIRSSFVDY